MQLRYENIIYVADISDLRLNDEDIWNYALIHNCIILTYDSDFVDMVTLRGFPPKIIRLRTGNISKLEMANKINDNMEIIESFL